MSQICVDATDANLCTNLSGCSKGGGLNVEESDKNYMGVFVL